MRLDLNRPELYLQSDFLINMECQDNPPKNHASTNLLSKPWEFEELSYEEILQWQDSNLKNNEE